MRGSSLQPKLASSAKHLTKRSNSLVAYFNQPRNAENDDSEDTNEDSGSAEDPEDQEGGSDNEDDDDSSSEGDDDDEEEEESSSDDDDGLSVILKGNGSSVAGEHKLLGTLQFTAQVSSLGMNSKPLTH